MSPDGAGLVALRTLAAAWRRAVPPEEPGRPDLLLVDRVDSTQRWARALLDVCLADEDEPEPYLCAALVQTAGRGRHRRTWASATGGVYATLVIRPADDEQLQSLPARMAIALATLANEVLGGKCRIKWPNDLVVGSRKLGGILVDVVSAGEGVAGRPWALVGFGLNHSQSDFGAASKVATSLATEVGLKLPFFEEFFAASLAAGFRAAAASPGGWLESYRALSAHQAGDRIEAQLGERSVEGRFTGFDEHGFLVLDGAAGPEVIRAGEVFSW